MNTSLYNEAKAHQILENIVVVVVKECKANYSSGVWLQYLCTAKQL